MLLYTQEFSRQISGLKNEGYIKMTNSCFMLAQRGTRIELVEGDFHKHEVGEAFLRKPALKDEWWVAVKVFNTEEHARLTSLVGLIGFDKTKALFALNALEDHSDIDPILETVDPRMGDMD
jgi:hypothetical protein